MQRAGTVGAVASVRGYYTLIGVRETSGPFLYRNQRVQLATQVGSGFALPVRATQHVSFT